MRAPDGRILGVNGTPPYVTACCDASLRRLGVEVIDLYYQHLKEGGILAVHVSNRYLDLQPVVRRAAEATGKEAVVVESEDDEEDGVNGATWILVTGNRGRFERSALREAGKPLPAGGNVRLWTDDYSNLFRILK